MDDCYDPNNKHRYELSDMEMSVLSRRSENSLQGHLVQSLKNGHFSGFLEPQPSGNDQRKPRVDLRVSAEGKNYTYDSEHNFIGNSNYMDSKYFSGEGAQACLAPESDLRRK